MYSCRQAFVMLLSTLAHRFRLAPLAAGLVLLTACASGGGSRAPDGVNALYTQLDQASKGYETALQQAREGDDQASEQSLEDSLDSLKQAAARCGDTPGCDSQRFFSVFDRLLHLKDGEEADRKSTRLNSSHMSISYAVFCLKKKKKKLQKHTTI